MQTKRKTEGLTIAELTQPAKPFAGQKWKHEDGREGVMIFDGYESTDYCAVLVDCVRASKARRPDQFVADNPSWSPVAEPVTLPLGTVLRRPDGRLLFICGDGRHPVTNAFDRSAAGFKGASLILTLVNGRVLASDLPPDWTVCFDPEQHDLGGEGRQ